MLRAERLAAGMYSQRGHVQGRQVEDTLVHNQTLYAFIPHVKIN